MKNMTQIFTRECPNCKKRITLGCRLRFLKGSTIICSYCESVLKLNRVFTVVNLIFSACITPLILSFFEFSHGDLYLIAMGVLIPIIFSIISLFSYSFKESEFLD